MPVDVLQSHAGRFNDKLANSFGRLMFVYHPPSGWESDLMRFPSLFVLISPLSPRVPSMWPFAQPHPKPRTFSLGTKACPRTPLAQWQRPGPRAAPRWAPSGAHVLRAAASKRCRVRGPSRTWFNPPVPFASQCLDTFPLSNPHFLRDMHIRL